MRLFHYYRTLTLFIIINSICGNPRNSYNFFKVYILAATNINDAGIKTEQIALKFCD